MKTKETIQTLATAIEQEFIRLYGGPGLRIYHLKWGTTCNLIMAPDKSSIFSKYQEIDPPELKQKIEELLTELYQNFQTPMLVTADKQKMIQIGGYEQYLDTLDYDGEWNDLRPEINEDDNLPKLPSKSIRILRLESAY